MAGSEYEPRDSRIVTQHPNEPGKPSGWRKADAANPDDSAKDKTDALAPADMRNVTDEGVTEPGAVPGWREKEAGGHKPAGAATPPPGVPQEGKPFTAEEAAESKH
jgi:hypothetical protein